MKVISVVNQKGGVGKTSLAANLSYQLSKSGYRVLAVDLDCQANMTEMVLGDQGKAGSEGIAAVFSSNPTDIHELVVSANSTDNYQWGTMSIIPNDIEFALTSMTLHSIPFRETLLSKALDKVSNEYDYCFVDCPPSLGDLIINAVMASDMILVPIGASTHSITGFDHLIRTIHSLDRSVENVRLVWNMYDSRSKIINAEIDSYLEPIKDTNMVLSSRVRINNAFEKANVVNMPIVENEPTSHGAVDVETLAKELVKAVEEI